MASKLDSLERVYFETREEWRRWLAENYARPVGIWLAFRKKRTGAARLSYDEIVEEALCFGWIDSLPRKLNDEWTQIMLTPRKPGSVWSEINRRRVEKLIAEGRMAPPGIAKVEAAKADGSWLRLEGSDSLAVPSDLAAALEAMPSARTNFDAFPPGVRKNILAWIDLAKRPSTRQARVEETARLAARNERAHQGKR